MVVEEQKKVAFKMGRHLKIHVKRQKTTIKDDVGWVNYNICIINHDFPISVSFLFRFKLLNFVYIVMF